MRMFSHSKKRLTIHRASQNVTRLLSGDMSAADEARMHELRKRAPEYQDEFLATARLMADLEELAQDRDIATLLDSSNEHPPVPKNQYFWPKLAVAAVLLLMVAVGYWALQQPMAPDTKINRYVTMIGEQKTVTLQDGTIITLNTGTLLLAEFSATARRVILERGEVFFDVAPDPQKPFTVNLGQRSVTVLGTAFNILRKSPDSFMLAVMEGEVSLHPLNDSAAINAPVLLPVVGEALRLSSAGQRRVKAGTVVEYDNSSQQLLAYRPPDIQQQSRWRTGILSFKSEPLSLVVKELNRYSPKKILIEDSSIMDIEIYATIRLDQIGAALEGLESTIPVKVVNQFDSIALSDARKNSGTH